MRTIVVYCHHGVRSLNVTNWLRQQGFEEGCNPMRGGIDAWSAQRGFEGADLLICNF